MVSFVSSSTSKTHRWDHRDEYCNNNKHITLNTNFANVRCYWEGKYTRQLFSEADKKRGEITCKVKINTILNLFFWDPTFFQNNIYSFSKSLFLLSISECLLVRLTYFAALKVEGGVHIPVVLSPIHPLTTQVVRAEDTTSVGVFHHQV